MNYNLKILTSERIYSVYVFPYINHSKYQIVADIIISIFHKSCIVISPLK